MQFGWASSASPCSSFSLAFLSPLSLFSPPPHLLIIFLPFSLSLQSAFFSYLPFTLTVHLHIERFIPDFITVSLTFSLFFSASSLSWYSSFIYLFFSQPKSLRNTASSTLPFSHSILSLPLTTVISLFFHSVPFLHPFFSILSLSFSQTVSLTLYLPCHKPTVPSTLSSHFLSDL